MGSNTSADFSAANTGRDAASLPVKTRIAILGAGMSGLCMAIQLRKLGLTDFVVIEKASSVGGTWRDNTYPNIACDVPSHVYSFSFELNPNWSHSYSGGKEIWDYCRRCVDTYGLHPYLYFNREVKAAEYDTTKPAHNHVGVQHGAIG